MEREAYIELLEKFATIELEDYNDSGDPTVVDPYFSHVTGKTTKPWRLEALKNLVAKQIKEAKAQRRALLKDPASDRPSDRDTIQAAFLAIGDEWPKTNARRLELIEYQIAEDNLTDEGLKELNKLQALASARQNILAPLPIVQLEQQLADLQAKAKAEQTKLSGGPPNWEAELLADTGLGPVPTGSVCRRCGSKLDERGYCTDSSCPYGDHEQTCEMGMYSHPDFKPGRKKVTCTCPR